MSRSVTAKNHRSLRLHCMAFWKGKRVYIERGSLVVNYLEQINSVINSALSEYRRIFVVRFDLRFPADNYEPDTAAISRFIDSLKAQLEVREERNRREGKRVYPCHLRYIWAKERLTSENAHYHVAIFLNRDAYFTLGRIRSWAHEDGYFEEWDRFPPSDERNLSDRIKFAWSSSLDLPYERMRGLVHFPNKPIYDLHQKSFDFDDQYENVFYRLSYLAKLDTKHYGSRSKNFGSSRS